MLSSASEPVAETGPPIIPEPHPVPSPELEPTIVPEPTPVPSPIRPAQPDVPEPMPGPTTEPPY